MQAEQEQVLAQTPIVNKQKLEQQLSPSIDTTDIKLDFENSTNLATSPSKVQFIDVTSAVSSDTKQKSSGPERMRLTASPFKPTVDQQSILEVSNFDLTAADQEGFTLPSSIPVDQQQQQADSSTQRIAAEQLQSKLEKQILLMKAQHQYIQNLQRANNVLKTKVRQLEEFIQQDDDYSDNFAAATGFPPDNNLTDNFQGVAQQKKQQYMTQGELVDDEDQDDTYQEMQVVSVGKIEEISRQEEGNRIHHVAQGGRVYQQQTRHFDKRPMPHHYDHQQMRGGYMRQHSRGGARDYSQRERTVGWQDQKENFESAHQRPQEHETPTNRFGGGYNHGKIGYPQSTEFFKASSNGQGAHKNNWKQQNQEQSKWPHDKFEGHGQEYNKVPHFVAPSDGSWGEENTYQQSQGRGHRQPARKQNSHVHAKVAADQVFQHSGHRNADTFQEHGGQAKQQSRPAFQAERPVQGNRGRGARITANSDRNLIQPLEHNKNDQRQRRDQASNNKFAEKQSNKTRGPGKNNFQEYEDDEEKNGDTFNDYQKLDMRPSAFYSKLANQTQQFEANRQHHRTQASFAKNEPTDEFKIKSYESGGYMIQSKVQFADRHQFYDEVSASENSTSPQQTKHNNDSPLPNQSSPQIYEIGAQNDYLPSGMREVKASFSPLKPYDAKTNLLNDFGLHPSSVFMSSDQKIQAAAAETQKLGGKSKGNPKLIRQRINAARETQQEDLLSDLIDQARAMGPDVYTWTDELDEAEGELIAMACGVDDPYAELNEQIAFNDEEY